MDILTRGNLRELHHAKILAAKEGVELEWTDDKIGPSKAYNRSKIEELQAPLDKFGYNRARAATALRNILRKHGLDNFKERHHYVADIASHDGSSLTTFDVCFEEVRCCGTPLRK